MQHNKSDHITSHCTRAAINTHPLQMLAWRKHQPSDVKNSAGITIDLIHGKVWAAASRFMLRICSTREIVFNIQKSKFPTGFAPPSLMSWEKMFVPPPAIEVITKSNLLDSQFIASSCTSHVWARVYVLCTRFQIYLHNKTICFSYFPLLSSIFSQIEMPDEKLCTVKQKRSCFHIAASL